MKIKRIIYLGYYIKKMNWQLLFKFFNHVKIENNQGKIVTFFDMFYSVFHYNISLLEYFQFRFFEKTAFERAKWAGTGFMYESIYKLNPPKNNYVLNDKIYFLTHYKKFIKHSFFTLKDVKENVTSFKNFISEKKSKIVLKNSHGNCGIGIEVIDSTLIPIENISQRLIDGGNNLVEEFVVQHTSLNKLSPSGLNTLRIITLIDEHQKVQILGARLRISVNNIVDNLAAGNIAAEVDQETGIVVGPGVYSDITKQEEQYHPVSGVKIIGFEIPYFKEAIQLASDAAQHNTLNRTVGWDIAITDNGPDIIEGNHDWCKLLWQLPVKKGLKHKLEEYV